MSEWVSIKEAGERYGVSADTIRRRLKRGEIVGRKESTAQGFVWQIEVASDHAESEHKASEQPPAAIGEDALELERLRERVAGLERERGDLIAQRDAWQEQARRSGEGEAQLRELVARAQAISQALPATAGGAREHAPEVHEAGGDSAPGRRGLLDRWRKR